LAKKKLEKPRYELTRRQHSRRQQQKRRQRIILGIAILIVVAVLSIIGVGVYQGWYVKDYKPLHEVVLEVNGTKFDMEYYTAVLDNLARQVSSQYSISVTEHLLSSLTGSAERAIEQRELVKQGAAKLGFTVSDDEVTETIVSSGIEDSPVIRDMVRVALLMNKMNDEYFDQQVPLSADQRHVMAMFLEGEAQANEVITWVEKGEDFGDIAAALSLDSVTKEAKGDLGWCPLGVLPLKVDSAVLEENAFSAEVGALSPPIYEEDKSRQLGYWLIEVESVDSSAEPTEANVKVMLFASEQEANDIKARLEAGEDFATLAKEFSLDTTSSADGGEITLSPGEKTTAFDAYVFDPAVELGVLSPVIKDTGISVKGGYWLIEVVGSQPNREIDSDSRDLLKRKVSSDWVSGLMDDPEDVIVNNLDETKLQWAVSYVLGG
jgi:hypothetical protein